MEGYRSGHNGAVLKTVRAKVHAGSNPAPSATEKKSWTLRGSGLLLLKRKESMKKYFDIHETGFNIRCKLFYEDNVRKIRKVVLYCHGFAGHKDTLAAERFSGYLLSKYKGYAVLAFDWPCHGEDVRKKLCLSDCDRYLSIVTDYVFRSFAPESISVCATSFGAYLVLKYIQEHGNPFHRIVLRSPAVGMYASITGSVITPEERELIEKGKDTEVGFDRRIRISKVFLEELHQNDITNKSFLAFADDIMIVHGTKDEIVSFDSVKEFAEENVIDLLLIQNADHRFVDPTLMNLAVSRMAAFLAE